MEPENHWFVEEVSLQKCMFRFRVHLPRWGHYSCGHGLRVQLGAHGNHLHRTLVGAHGAIGAQAVEHALSGASNIGRRVPCFELSMVSSPRSPSVKPSNQVFRSGSPNNPSPHTSQSLLPGPLPTLWQDVEPLADRQGEVRDVIHDAHREARLRGLLSRRCDVRRASR